MTYVDPNPDLTFKRVFGEHPDLVMSFLNALLPLAPGQEITEIEYLPSEMVPDNPLRKNSIVDVRCKDKQGRLFLVEMQMVWSPEFQQRVLFNASKAYVRQVKTGEEYKYLQPVYSLNLVNEIFEPDLKGYYHYYQVMHVEHSDRVIKGLHLLFIELPKFNPHTFSEKKMHVLWLRFLTEIDDNTREIPADLLNTPETKKAVNIIEESAFTDAQLAGYEKFWDVISVEKTLYGSGYRQGIEDGREKGLEEGMKEGLKEGREKGLQEGLKEGLKEGRKEGIKEGRKEGLKEGKYEIARTMKSKGLDLQMIMELTGLTRDEIESIN